MDRTYTWEHWDDPSITNTADVHFTNEGLRASGIQHGRGYTAHWSLDAADGWVTRRLSIGVAGDGWSRSLELSRDDGRVWTSETTLTGEQPSDLPAPGIAPGEDLSDALDCDLGLCPLTNTMPIRRLGLLYDRVPKTRLIMALVDMPSLQVIASDQYYASVDSTTVSYASGTRGVDVELKVDQDGVVLTYPDLARRRDD